MHGSINSNKGIISAWTLYLWDQDQEYKFEETFVPIGHQLSSVAS